ncbi:MAG: spermidine/putrescine ABC transporter permease PotB, partial [Waltera sp.]
MTKTKITSNRRRRSGNVGLMIPMYVFTILFVALPILYLFLLSFLQRAQVWGVDFTFTLDNYKRILEPLYLDTFWQSLKLAFTATFFVALIGYPYGYFMAKMNA